MAHMNGGFEKHGLDEDAFGPKGGFSNLKTFDAFRKLAPTRCSAACFATLSSSSFVPANLQFHGCAQASILLTTASAKTKPTYTSASPRGGQWTIALLVFCTLLTITELRTWWSGEESHHFSVERGVGHELQLNLDVVVAMRCSDLHVNVQDAAMDRILAGELLTKDDTNWQLWTDKFGDRRRRGGGAYKALHEKDKRRQAAEEEDQRVGHVLGHMREGGRKFAKTPKLSMWEKPDSCRIFGSLEGNKVQGDFHITARGHGYMEFGLEQHLDHSSRLSMSALLGPAGPNFLSTMLRGASWL
jgi:hypothetical protein